MGDSGLIRVPSPLAPGFAIGNAQSPEEYLLGFLADTLGLELIKERFGEKAAEPARLALAHTAMQWAVEQALGRDFTSRYLAQVKVQGETTPLRGLLNPTLMDATGSRPAERHLFLRFAIASYGRETVAPFLRAVMQTNSAEALVEAAFHEGLSDVEKQWRDWLDIGAY